MKAIALTLLLWTLTVGLAGAASVTVPAASAIRVRDIHNTLVRPLQSSDRAATVLIFIAHDCPICNSYSAEIHRLRNDYAASHIALFVVYTDTDASAATLHAHAQAHGYSAFALFDTNHALVKLTGATVTPEAVVLGPHDHILYEGRIDNRFKNFGEERDVASVSDLRRALDAVRLGQPIKVTRTTAVGCYIPGLPGS